MFLNRRYAGLAQCLFTWLLLCSQSSPVASAKTTNNIHILQDVEDSVNEGVGLVKRVANQIGTTYQSLSPRNQLIASGLTGFVVSRLVVNSAVGALKVGLAAYVVSEALHYSGALDTVRLSDEQTDMLNNLKDKAMRQAANYRQQVHRRLNPGTIQTFVQKERNAALGLAGGAFLGILL